MERQGLVKLSGSGSSADMQLMKPLLQEDPLTMHNSRYRNEFQEISLLGKGGFGSVFKAKNYLDGEEYAVKKIRFAHKHTSRILKILREVKALAKLQHANIVGYRTAWLEYDSPFTNQVCITKSSTKKANEKSQNGHICFS